MHWLAPSTRGAEAAPAGLSATPARWVSVRPQQEVFSSLAESCEAKEKFEPPLSRGRPEESFGVCRGGGGGAPPGTEAAEGLVIQRRPHRPLPAQV